MQHTLLYTAIIFLGMAAVATTARAIAREARERRSREREQALREHPELTEIAASTWRT